MCIRGTYNCTDKITLISPPPPTHLTDVWDPHVISGFFNLPHSQKLAVFDKGIGSSACHLVFSPFLTATKEDPFLFFF
jgi:hypothetical protein